MLAFNFSNLKFRIINCIQNTSGFKKQFTASVRKIT